MNDYFKLKNRIKLTDITEETKIPTSDFAAIEDGYFIQLEYVEEKEEKKPLVVKPGIFCIKKTMEGLKLESTSFSSNNICLDYDNTKMITEKVDKFIAKKDIYKKFGIDPAKRGVLLYGRAGTGKSLAIRTVCEKYGTTENKALVLIWKTDVFEPYDVQSLIKRFDYQDVELFILVAEDIGGVEKDEVKQASDSSLLALLDNTEKAFKIPTLVMATTNHPEVFLGNLTNRRGRFDDVIEVPLPTPDERIKLYNFYSQQNGTEPNQEFVEEFRLNKYNRLNAADIQDIFLRSELYDLNHKEAADQIVADIKKFEDLFQDKKKLGIGFE